MNMVVADGYTANPGDLSWEPITALGTCTVYDYTKPDEVVPRCKDAEVIITNKVLFTKENLSQLPKLRYLGVLATGYNVVDLEAATKRNVIVTNVPNYCTESVVQMVFAHILELLRNVGHHAESVRQGRWAKQRDFCYWDTPQIELSGKTMGLLGYGAIGKSVASVALTFGMSVIAHDVITPKNQSVSFVDFESLLQQSDILSLHCPLTDSTKEIINKRTLEKMKSSALLINTSRGPLIREQDLADALVNGTIAGAGLDVLVVEPPLQNNFLFQIKNCNITPHIAWASVESRQRLINSAAKNIQAFLKGTPINCVG